MARIKCNINEDSTLVKFESVMDGEIFMFNDEPYMKVKKTLVWDEEHGFNAFGLINGDKHSFNFDTLVTYVKSAELKLTI